MENYFLQGGGPILEQFAAVDWKNNPLGDIDSWPESLKTSYSTCLNCPFPMLICWGDQLTMLYNTAYSRFINQTTFCTSLGVAAEECWAEIWHIIGPMLRGVKETGKSIFLEDQLYPLNIDGHREDRYFSFSYSPIRDNEGIRGVLTVVYETTEKIVNAQIIKQEKERLARFFNQAPAAICVLSGPDFIFELANPLFQQLFPNNSFIGHPLLEVIPYIKTSNVYKILVSVYQTGQTYEGKEVLVPFMRNDNEELVSLYFNFIYQARKNNRGEIDGIFVFAYEVNELVRAKKQVEINFNRFEKLANLLPQIVWTANPGGKLDYFNNQWFTYSGLSYDQSAGDGWSQAIHPDDLPHLIEIWKRSIHTGAPYQVEARLRSAAGSYQWALIRALPVRNEDKVINQWCGTSTFINDQKENEQKLQALSKKLFHANEEIQANNKHLVNLNSQLTRINSELDNFIYTASHDLKAPISNIEGLMNSLAKNLPGEVLERPLINKVIHMIDSSVERFKNTIENLTNITKLQKEQNDDITFNSLATVIDEVLLDLQMPIKETDAEIVVDVSECPSINYSMKNLRSVFYNLISNALKYRSDRRKPRIEIRSSRRENFCLVMVKDNGLGIDPSNLDKIWTMFKRLHTHVEGTGIGLYIVKKIVENSDGKIEVESALGKGSVFKVYLKI